LNVYVLILENVHNFIKISNKELQLHEEIGRGGFGAVHRATWLTRRHIVAVKNLHLTHLNSEAKKQFFIELDVMDRVRSPHVINFYAACIEKENYALIMEYMSLGSLYEMLHDGKTVLVWPQRLSIALQSAKGTHYLHQLQPPILHRDVKSLNLLLERAHEGYTVKLCDFGLAHTRSETSCLTAVPNLLACTLQWTAPEILRLERHTEKSDIYSLGVVYWELATGQKPYEYYKDVVIRESVLAGGRLEIPEITPSSFGTVIHKCWAHDPVDRPNSSDLVEMIEKCIEMQSNTHVFLFCRCGAGMG
jgi:serine/threonine-protein kinase CTR1